MCAIGLTDSLSRYVIINEATETDPLTLTHSYWPPSIPLPSLPFHHLVRSDRVRPEMVNKSLSHTTTTTAGVMAEDDLPSPSFLLFPPLFHHVHHPAFRNYSFSKAIKCVLTTYWLVGTSAIEPFPVLHNQGHISPRSVPSLPGSVHQVIGNSSYNHNS